MLVYARMDLYSWKFQIAQYLARISISLRHRIVQKKNIYIYSNINVGLNPSNISNVKKKSVENIWKSVKKWVPRKHLINKWINSLWRSKNCARKKGEKFRIFYLWWNHVQVYRHSQRFSITQLEASKSPPISFKHPNRHSSIFPNMQKKTRKFALHHKTHVNSQKKKKTKIITTIERNQKTKRHLLIAPPFVRPTGRRPWLM